ncbi:hypothetical protein DEU56DRAFT_717544, partial [Suillus clintonianus]|uniref:uncharacterized protein n=1 Tax=Suillus clintonianus TaxID=1904413 RepID=UPI001B8725F8
CNYCSTSVEGRDNKPLKHILDRNTCPTAPDHARTDVCTDCNYLTTKNRNKALLLPPIVDADSSSSPSGDMAKAPQKRKNLFGFVDLPVTPEQAIRANFKLFRFIVHANIPFLVAENWFFHNFLDEIWPSYQAPSRYVL